ncbi:MAG TPA: LLM class flavin-dependent oxidoreductase, partial [Devosia sp.]|nr:LLM class flavin-dependent oxidoreductase [Devosia sp.]
LGRVIVPTDSAPAARVARYKAFAEARHPRTLSPQGEKRTLFPPDLVGSSEQILDWLLADPVLPLVDELRLELPYEFSPPEYEQILTDTIERIAPALGWSAGTQIHVGAQRHGLTIAHQTRETT